MNQCPHNLDLWQWICGMPVRVEAHMHFGKWHDIEVEDDVTAYMEFENESNSVLNEVENYDNLIVLKTCSKAFGMAAIRLGIAVTNEKLTGILHAIVIIAIIAAVLFVLSFAVYFFNLDMKLTAALAPLFEKHYDKIDRDKHL